MPTRLGGEVTQSVSQSEKSGGEHAEAGGLSADTTGALSGGLAAIQSSSQGGGGWAYAGAFAGDTQDNASPMGSALH